MKAPVAFLALVLVTSETLAAGAPGEIAYQGFITQDNTPVEGTHDLEFAVFADSSGQGSPLWQEGHQAVPITVGIFKVFLGRHQPFPSVLFAEPNRFLETKVDGQALLPRTRLATVPYAFAAGRSDTAAFAQTGGSAESLWETNGTDVYRTSGNVGIGTNTPGSTLHVLSSSTTAEFQEAGSQGLIRFRDQATGNAPHIGSSGDDFVVLTGPASSEKLRVLSGGYLSLTSSLPYSLERFTAANTVNAPHIGASGDNFVVLTGPSTNEVFRVTSDGNVGIGTTNPTSKLHVAGDICVTGAKNAIVPTSKGMTKLYCDESTEVWFSDRGEAQLINGRAHVELHPLFLETVSISEAHPMKVWVTYYGPHGNAYVVRGLTGFEVIDPDGGNAQFSWQVEAKRKGYEEVRLEPADRASTREGRE